MFLPKANIGDWGLSVRICQGGISKFNGRRRLPPALSLSSLFS